MLRLLKLSCAISLALVLSFSAWAENPADVDQLRDTRSCADCSLGGASFDNEDLSAAILTNATLYMSSLSGTNLSGADLSGANLGKSLLDGTDLSGANLAGADLSGADLSTANLNGADLTDAVTDSNTTCPDASSGPCQF